VSGEYVYLESFAGDLLGERTAGILV